MKLACALVIAGILLASAAFAVTTYTETLYPSPFAGYTGENWIGLRGAPIPPAGSTNAPGNPLDIFPDLGLIDDGKLMKLTPTNNNLEGYYSFQEPGGPFGNMLLGEGYKLFVGDGQQHTMTYQGVDDGVPANGVMTDMWISLPGFTGAAGGNHWISNPFNHNVLWSNIKVTDGTVTIPVAQAVSDGWLMGYWQYMDAPGQNLYNVDPDGIVGSDSLEPGRCYEVITMKSNLALIIPAN